jgi:hypothetical protein
MAKRVKHIVFLKFQPSCTAADIKEVWRLIDDLPKQISGILRLTGGPNVSTEGLDQGYTHSFAVDFESVAARDAYLPHPAHQAAAKKLMEKLQSVIVCDHEFEA